VERWAEREAGSEAERESDCGESESARGETDCEGGSETRTNGFAGSLLASDVFSMRRVQEARHLVAGSCGLGRAALRFGQIETEGFKMEKQEVLQVLCELASRVGGQVFHHSQAHDCFCTEKPIPSGFENVADAFQFEFSPLVLEFIVSAVDAKIAEAKQVVEF